MQCWCWTRWQRFAGIRRQRFRLWMGSTIWREDVSYIKAWEMFSAFSNFLFLSLKVIFTSQMIFGIFPVCGLRQRSSSQLSFKLKSFSFVFSTLVQCGIALMFTTSIYKQLNSRIEYTKVGKSPAIPSDWWALNQPNDDLLRFLFTVKFIFLFLNFLVYFNFTIVASKWPQFVIKWENAERKLMELQVMQHQDAQIKRRIKRILLSIMLMAFSNLLFLLNALVNAFLSRFSF